jgi:hypothetical protein
MEFFLGGMLSRAKPAACAASPVDFVAREINVMTFFAVCLHRQCRLSAPLVRLA